MMSDGRSEDREQQPCHRIDDAANSILPTCVMGSHKQRE